MIYCNLHCMYIYIDETPCKEGDVRLFGGSSTENGRLEICHGNIWGTVCDDGWNSKNGLVACRQLGYNDYVAHTNHIHIYLEFSYGEIFYDDVSCFGNETRLTDCQHRGQGIHNCYHYEDIILYCTSERI